ncbi:tRNA nucleotidyltransferase/poly(A) polymerase [Bacillus sp. SORGH_AS 510]|uniref:flagellar protein FliT n=1 Tax=Bacillus sp. SORGH_AS_0510 TaxID=3041771 RepID=UPI00277FDDB5|nr:flagellar protein FliT [Bacillus sp. SORGH_AS_0510]MDQ1146287.1 tRNA nucleotidyltransferase/poly(A) polymerase [Bacillus sp. SORGH_AS_0510]
MNELLKKIYEVTVEMCHLLKEENYEEFEKLLDDRNTLMCKVDELKNSVNGYVYSSSELKLLKDTFQLDQEFAPLLEKKLSETKILINQQKKQKLVSQQYRNYTKQTNGIFLDSKR